MKCHGWSATIPRMVTHHSKGAHPLSKIYQKELCYRLEIWHLDFTQKIKTRWSGDGQPPSPRWSPNIPRMVTHHPESTRRRVYCRLGIWHIDLTNKIKTRWSAMDGQPPSPGWSPTIPNLPEGSVLQIWNLAPRLNSQNQDQVKYHGWSAAIPRMVTHHP